MSEERISAREQAERDVAARLGITLEELYERARRTANTYDLIQAQLYANLRKEQQSG